MSLDRDPTPTGKWRRQITMPMYSRVQCDSWYLQIEENGISEAKVARCKDHHMGRSAWAVFARKLEKRLKTKMGSRRLQTLLLRQNHRLRACLCGDLKGPYPRVWTGGDRPRKGL